MRLLLDTHVFLWLVSAPERLGPGLRLLDDESNELLVSAVSSWEIAIKVGLGKLRLPEAAATWMPTRMATVGATALPIEHADTLEVLQLPTLHRDPFDRLLVAQARRRDLTIVSADPQVLAYDASTLPIR